MLSFASHLSASGTHCSLQIIFIIDHIYAPGSPHPQGYNLQDAPTNPLMTMNDCAHPAILTSLPLPLPSSPDPTQPQITSGPLKKRTPKSPYAPTPGVLEPGQSTTLFPVPRVAEACTSAFLHAASVTLRPAAVEGYRECLRNSQIGPNSPRARGHYHSEPASRACRAGSDTVPLTVPTVKSAPLRGTFKPGRLDALFPVPSRPRRPCPAEVSVYIHVHCPPRASSLSRRPKAAQSVYRECPRKSLHRSVPNCTRIALAPVRRGEIARCALSACLDAARHGPLLCLVQHRWRDDPREDGTKPATAAPHSNGHGERTPHAMPSPLSGVCAARSGNGHGGCTPRAAAPPTGLHPPEPWPPSRLCRSVGEPNNNELACRPTR